MNTHKDSTPDARGDNHKRKAPLRQWHRCWTSYTRHPLQPECSPDTRSSPCEHHSSQMATRVRGWRWPGLWRSCPAGQGWSGHVSPVWRRRQSVGCSSWCWKSGESYSWGTSTRSKPGGIRTVIGVCGMAPVCHVSQKALFIWSSQPFKWGILMRYCPAMGMFVKGVKSVK